VDQVTGKVWVVFFDRRNYADANTDVFMAVSEDGGDTFTNFKVSESPFLPFSTVFFGHYLGLTAHNDHVFPVWNRMDDGENSLLGAIVDPAIIGQEELYRQPGAQIQNYPNPFTESSFISFRLKEASAITLQLFDITGKEISTLIRGLSYPKGKHVTRIEAEELGLTPGVYILRLSAGNEQITTRMMLTE
jgi:hypothetical protein